MPLRAIIAPWKLALHPASYKEVGFYVEVDTKASGRRIHVHEYPKRDVPYAEDMGRHAKKFSITCYVIGRQRDHVWTDYQEQRDKLIKALETEGSGKLVRPTTNQDDDVLVESYSVSERREKGGFAQFEITFVEAGVNIANTPQADTPAVVNNAATAVVDAAKASAEAGLNV
jgi:prophage DNA circulation protein